MPINTPTGYLDITNATLRGSKIVTTGFVGIANANPTNHLSVGSNLHINDTHSNVLQISGNINAASVVLGGISIAPTFDLEIVTNTGNTTPYTVEFNNTTTAFVTTANATIGDTLTASKLVGDGSGISAIQSSNVTDFASNVSRITALETDLGNNSARITNLSSNLSDNSARITNLSSNLSDNSARITNLSSNLSDNSSRITALETGNMSISGDKTFTGDIIFESNVHMNGGNVFVANTVNLTVSDPIIELGSNNIGANDLGIIMTRPNNNSNVAVVFDESVDILRMGYTLNGANDSIVDLDSNALAVSVQGALSAASVSGDGSGLTSLNASNITTGALSTTSVTIDDYLIHDGDTDTKVGFPLADTFTVTTANSERIRVDSSGNVGIGTDSPAYTLDVHGTANVGALYSTLTHSNAASNIVTWNSSTNEIIDSGLEKGFTEHPVAAMTDYHTYVEGHGTYEASESNVFSGTTAYGWKIFDYETSTDWATNGGYDSSTGAFTSDVTTTDVGGTRYNGHWVQIKTPYPITLSHSNVYPTNVNRSPVDSVILGSNDDKNWYKLNEFTGQTYSASTWKQLDVNATTPYQYYRMCVTKKAIGDSVLGIREWRLFAEKDVTKFENVHISGDLSSETLQTGYIKWPRKSLKANESEGYVVDASSADSGFTRIYSVFNDLFIGQSTEYWDSASTYSTSTGAHNNTVSTTDIDGVVRYGEWVQIKLTNAIALHSMKWYPRIFYSSGTTYATWPLERVPKSGVIMGSNDGITWRTLRDFADISYTTAAYVEGTEVKVISSTSYVYYRLVITSLNAGTSSDRAGIMELQLFEAATGVGGAPTSAKLQVHGSLGLAKGSSLYAGDSVVAEFPKHDRPLTKYPEVAMTAASTGGYTASVSRHLNSSNTGWMAFDRTGSVWITGYDTYDITDGTYLRDTTFEDVDGEYLKLEMPKSIKLKHVKFTVRTSPASNPPNKGRIYGSNDDATWIQLHAFDDLNISTYPAEMILPINSTEYYRYYVFQIEEATISTNQAYASVNELEYWGHEEGDESVDVVHRSVPNKPGQQQLAVYWDANDSNSYSFADSSNVYDLSGSGVTGVITGTNGFDAEYNAWVFDGTSDIRSTVNTFSGDQPHTMSVWVYISNALTTADGYISILAPNTGETIDEVSSIRFQNDGFNMQSWGNDIRMYNLGIQKERWYHLTAVYDGGGVTTASKRLYINSVQEIRISTDATSGNTINFTNTTLSLGSRVDGTGSHLKGSIANFRLFSKALNADQVRELYDYDAPRFGHRTNVVALHKGNLGVGVTAPTSRFEVAGTETLQEYPPRAMTGFDTYMEGHGVFRANWANWYSGNTPWGMYTKTPNSNSQTTIWYGPYQANNGYSGGNVYSGTDFAASTTSGLFLDDVNGTRYYGAWTTITMPYDIILKRIHLYQAGTSDAINARCTPEDGVILGSHNGSDWYHVHTFTGLTYGGSVGTSSYSAAGESVVVNAIHSYKHYALITTRTLHYAFTVIIGELYWYGTPAPSGLEDGHLTLGKALTAPAFHGSRGGCGDPTGGVSRGSLRHDGGQCGVGNDGGGHLWTGE